MPIHIDAYSDGHLSEYSYTESYDTVDELLKRFTLDYVPKYSLKLRDRKGSLITGVDFSCNSRGNDRVLSFVVKPASAEKWWRRVRVTHTGNISLRSRKLTWWVFAVDLQGEVNPITRAKDVSFRVATAWDVTGGRYQNKKKLKVTDGIEGRVHWSINYDLPELSGHFRSNDVDTVNDMNASLGYAHAEISRVELAVWPRNLSIPKTMRKRDVLEGSSNLDEKSESVEEENIFSMKKFFKKFV
ncbi:hypothetical protein M9435_005048 [Picochlorum sp. BPE23]|nr:hypothetical protein M9435_005048 [Picochlorum sp. BPE23]